MLFKLATTLTRTSSNLPRSLPPPHTHTDHIQTSHTHIPHHRPQLPTAHPHCQWIYTYSLSGRYLQVLIRVNGSSCGVTDMVEAGTRPWFPLGPQRLLGYTVGGTVAAVGPGASNAGRWNAPSPRFLLFLLFLSARRLSLLSPHVPLPLACRAFFPCRAAT